MKRICRQGLFLIGTLLLSCQHTTTPYADYQSWWDTPHTPEPQAQAPSSNGGWISAKNVIRQNSKQNMQAIEDKIKTTTLHPHKVNIAVGTFSKDEHSTENQEILNGFLKAYWHSPARFKADTHIRVYDLSKFKERKFYRSAQHDGSYTVILHTNGAHTTHYAALGEKYYQHIYDYIQTGDA